MKPIGKPNLLFQQIAAVLVANPDKGLAKNVSWLNVERFNGLRSG